MAACKHMYDNFAFGDGQMSWNDPAGALGLTMEQVQSARSLDAAEPEAIGTTMFVRSAENAAAPERATRNIWASSIDSGATPAARTRVATTAPRP